MRIGHCRIITDVQNYFYPGGAPAVAEGGQITPAINKISSKLDKVVAMQEGHPQGHISFKVTEIK
jgi:nicotinamidase/pyrazinamidase